MAREGPMLRILIVDDEPLIRWSLAETLAEAGHVISQAGDGAAALRALRTDPYDVVLLDYRLPDSNSLALLASVRQIAPGSAVIMLKAHGTPDIATGALNLGAFSVMPKPFEVHEIAALVLQAHAVRLDSLTAEHAGAP